MYFPVNIAKFLRIAFAHYPFSKFYVIIEFFGRLLVQSWRFPYFVFPNRESMVILYMFSYFQDF